jgi:hypothetical protein
MPIGKLDANVSVIPTASTPEKLEFKQPAAVNLGVASFKDGFESPTKNSTDYLTSQLANVQVEIKTILQKIDTIENKEKGEQDRAKQQDDQSGAVSSTFDKAMQQLQNAWDSIINLFR